MRKESDFWKDFTNPADDFGDSMDFGGPSYADGYNGEPVVMPEKKKGHGAIVVLISLLVALIPTAMIWIMIVLPIHRLIMNPGEAAAEFATQFGGQFAEKFYDQYQHHQGNYNGSSDISDYIPDIYEEDDDSDYDSYGHNYNDDSDYDSHDYNYNDDSDGDSNGFLNGTDREYILPQSNQRYLSSSDIAGMNIQQINYAKNEIYARYGRKFKSTELQEYFDSKSWYRGTIDPEVFDNVVSLTDVERANAEFLSEVEHSMDPNGYQPAQ